jgi:hypothetical protein
MSASEPVPILGYYFVWHARFNLDYHDQDIIPDTARYHHGIYIEDPYDYRRNSDRNPEPDTGKPKLAIIHDVTGSLASGMKYAMRDLHKPIEGCKSYSSKTFLGYTPIQSHPSAWCNILGGLPAPHKQKAFNFRHMRYEQFKTLKPLKFYKRGDHESRPPLFGCAEWTEQLAIPALRQRGLILDEEELYVLLLGTSRGQRCRARAGVATDR